MKRKYNRIGLIVATLLVVICLVGVGIINSQGFKEYAASYVAKRVTASLDKKVDLRSLSITSLDSAELTDLTVYDSKQQPFIKAKKIEFKVSLWDIITGQELAGIEKVTITDGEGWLVKNDKNQWNYEDFISKESSEGSPKFKGKLELRNSTVHIDADQMKATLKDIEMVGDLADMDAIKVQGTASLNGARLRVEGVVGNKENTNINIEGSQLLLKDYVEYIPKEYADKFKLISGKIGNFDLSIGYNKDHFVVTGPLKIQDLGVDYQGYKLRNVEALLDFKGNNVGVLVTGKLQNQELKVTGEIANLFTKPSLQLNLEGRNIDLGLLAKMPELQGKVNAEINLNGPLDNWSLQGKVDSKELTYNGFKVTAPSVRLRYMDNQVYIDDVKAQLGNGWLWAAGTYNMNTQAYIGQFKAKKVDISPIITKFASNNLPLSGILDGSGIFQGQGTDFSKTEFNMTFNLLQGSYERIAFNSVTGNLYKHGSTVTLGAGDVKLAAGGSVAINGTFKDNAITAKVYGSNINLALLDSYVPILHISGNGNIYAEVKGTLTKPIATVKFVGKNGTLMGQGYDTFDVSATTAGEVVNIDYARLMNKDKLIDELSGSIQLSGAKLLDLTLTTKDARLEKMINIINPDLGLTGNISNEMTITGSMNNPAIKGHVKLYEGSFKGMLISNLEGDYSYIDGALELRGFNIESPFINGKVEGTMSPQGVFDINISQGTIDIARFPIEYPYPVKGKVTFSGSLTGTISNPIFKGNVLGNDVTLNGQKIENLQGNILFRDRLISIDNVKFSQNGGDFSLSGKYNIDNHWIFGLADIKNGSSNSALAMINMKNEILRGRFNGNAELTGTLEKPSISISGEMPTGTLKDYPLKNISVALEYSDEVLKLEKFYGEQGNGKVGAVGEANFKNRTIKGQLSANGMDPSLFAKLANVDVKIEGSLNGDLQVRGNLDNPDADISVYVEGNGRQFNNAYVLANLKNNILHINQGVVNRGTSALKMDGTIPLAALNMNKYSDKMDPNSQMNMRVYLENTDLSMLPSLTPYVEWATGKVKGNLYIKGTLGQPIFDGSLSTTGSAIKFKYLDNPVENLNADITFKDQKISMNDFSGKIGNGNFKATGYMNVAGSGLNQYQFNLNMDKLTISSPYYKGPLTGEVNIAPVKYLETVIPKLTVNMNFNNITIGMPPLPESSDEPLPLMALDIKVNAGENVHAYNPLLFDLYLKGGFNIKGTTRVPQSSGELNVINGTVNVLKTVFKINTGAINFNQFGSFFPNVDFMANTKVDRTQVFVSVKGNVGEQLTTKLYSDPPMPEAEIIKLLAFRTGGQGSEGSSITQSDVLSLATIGLQMSFLNEIESNLKNMLHLDELRISRDTLSEANRLKYDVNTNEVYNVEIGKYISNKLLLKYTHGINYDLSRIGIQYDLNKNIGILGEYENGGKYDVKLEMQWKF